MQKIISGNKGEKRRSRCAKNKKNVLTGCLWCGTIVVRVGHEL